MRAIQRVGEVHGPDPCLAITAVLMARQLICDGCETAMGHETLTVGHLDPVVYCDECAEAWQEYEAERVKQLTAVIEHFEAWRRAERVRMRARLRRLPDDVA